MLNTGTAIGVMCNVLPAGILLPKHVPSFTAVLYGRVAPGFPLDQIFETARTVMGRRGKVFGEDEEQLYLALYEQTRLERERAFQRRRAPRRLLAGRPGRPTGPDPGRPLNRDAPPEIQTSRPRLPGRSRRRLRRTHLAPGLASHLRV